MNATQALQEYRQAAEQHNRVWEASGYTSAHNTAITAEMLQAERTRKAAFRTWLKIAFPEYEIRLP